MSYKQYMSIMAGICLALILAIVVVVKCTVDDLSGDRPRITSSLPEVTKVVYQKPDTTVDFPRPAQAHDTAISKEDSPDDSSLEVQ